MTLHDFQSCTFDHSDISPNDRMTISKTVIDFKCPSIAVDIGDCQYDNNQRRGLCHRIDCNAAQQCVYYASVCKFLVEDLSASVSD